MAREPKYRIRVRGRQRDDIDLDLLVQALIQIGEERARRVAEAEQPGAQADDEEAAGTP